MDYLARRTLRQRVALDAVRLAPKGLFSGVVGWSARRTIPRQLRAPAYRAFARLVGANLSEVELPLADYPSLGDFFARRLTDDARVVNANPHEVISPSDGVMATIGRVDHDTLVQAKGIDYSLAQLLGDGELAAKLEGGHAFTVYLSPKDYHRVHAPVAGELTSYTYVPGTLFPVSKTFADNVDGLFARNERVVFRLETSAGPVAVVMVGATGVGNMALAHAGVETRTYRGSKQAQRVCFDQPVAVAKGDELGAFHLGSTVVMVFGAEAMLPDAQLRPGQAIRFGEVIGSRSNAGSKPVGIAG